jgi:uncharacterized membrane protein
MIKNHKLNTASLITSALSLALFTVSSTINAESQREQCAGIVKAGLSDCASVEHICAGMNTDDSSETDWLWLPIGTCNKIIGAHTLKASKPADSEKTAKKG